jgi:hypothetical protein
MGGMEGAEAMEAVEAMEDVVVMVVMGNVDRMPSGKVFLVDVGALVDREGTVVVEVMAGTVGPEETEEMLAMAAISKF